MKLEVGSLADIGAEIGDIVEEGTCGHRLIIGYNIGHECPWVLKNIDDGEVDDFMGITKYWRIIKKHNSGLVRTVTRREVVPGVYSGVRITANKGDEQYPIWLKCDDAFSSTELRAAAATLTEIADALEDE